MVKQVNNWWVRMAAALLAAFSLMGWVIAKTPPLSSQTVTISADALFTAATDFTPADIQRLLKQHNSPLAAYTEAVGEQNMSAAEIFWAASQHADYGFNPKALLVTLYLEDGLNWTQPGGLYAHLNKSPCSCSAQPRSRKRPPTQTEPSQSPQSNLPRSRPCLSITFRAPKCPGRCAPRCCSGARPTASSLARTRLQ